MKYLRRSEERGRADHGWLRAKHSFSFSSYYDPAHMGFRDLRVINEDKIAAGAGFPFHGHRDMEIVTVVVKGLLEHQDTMGNKEQIRPWEVQRMSAGTGVQHSEYNALQDGETHLLQIWLFPREEGLTPSYEQKSFQQRLEQESWIRVISPEGQDGSLKINQDVSLWLGDLKAGQKHEIPLSPQRHGWLQLIEGELQVEGGESLRQGDGLALSQESLLALKAEQDSKFLFFDLR